MTAVYPGSFDPITYGHIDIIRRASAICDRLVIGVLDNVNKKPLFSVEERMEMIREAVADMKNVEVKSFDGFSVTFAREYGASVIVRGLRGESDFAYEQQLARVNRCLDEGVDTVFFSAGPADSIISSSGAKEIAVLGGDVSKFVPPAVARRLAGKLNNNRR